MQSTVERARTRFALSFPRRWSPVYQWVGDGLLAGLFGQLESINVQFPSNFVHTGTHAFDVLRMWGGEVATVQGWLQDHSDQVQESGYQFGDPNQNQAMRPDLGGFALLTFENRGIATVHAQNKQYFRFEFEILTDECMLRIGNTQVEYWRSSQSPHFTGFRELSRQPLPEFPPVNVFSAIAENLTSESSVRCDAKDGVKSLEIALAIHQSRLQGHTPVRPSDVHPSFGVASR